MRVNSFLHTIAVLAVAVSTLLLVGCGIDAPTTSFQGYLTDPAGSPVADGTYDAEYALFASPTGTSPVYTETGTITVTNGLFSTSFGGANPDIDTDALAQELWLQVTINGETLSPRQRLQGAPFAWTLVSGSVIAAQEDITRTLVGFDNVGAGLLVGNFATGTGAGSGILGTTYSNNPDAAGVLGASQDGAYGGRFSSEEYRGLRTDTNNASFYTAAFFGGIGIYVEGNCTGCRMVQIGQNVGTQAIPVGSLLAASGVTVDAKTGAPVLQVRLANSPSDVIVGVALGESSGYADHPAMPDLVLKDTAANGFMSIGVSGLFQVKVIDGTEVTIGDYLTAGANGATVLANRADSNNTSARVMSAPDTDGMVWVMLGGQ